MTNDKARICNKVRIPKPKSVIWILKSEGVESVFTFLRVGTLMAKSQAGL